MSIRGEAVERARAQGLCTQCLKNKTASHRYQCQRCIDTNHRKQERKRMKADRENLCSRCGRAPRREGRKTCDPCAEKLRERWRKGYYKRKKLEAARKEAFGDKDTGTGKRKYTKRMPIAPVQMAGMVNDLEQFIGNIKHMSAMTYLEAREELITSIIRRGKTDGNS